MKALTDDGTDVIMLQTVVHYWGLVAPHCEGSY